MDSFYSVRINDFKVILVQDTLYEIRISGEDNIIPEIHFTNTNGILEANVTEGVHLRVKRKPEIYVHFVDIDELLAEQAEYRTLGSITTDSLIILSNSTDFKLELAVDRLTVDLAGNGMTRGRLAVTGNARQTNVLLTRNGAFDSPALTGENCQISYQDGSFYRIKLDNFEETNVRMPSNRLQNIGTDLLRLLAY